MATRTALIIAVLAALALFTALNWGAFTTPTSISLAFTQVQAPLGLILLGFIALLGLLFLVFALHLQATTLMESRRLARELEAQRRLADEAEASRFTQLNQRIDTMQRELVAALERTENAVAAQVGELDDRLSRGWPQKPD